MITIKNKRVGSLTIVSFLIPIYIMLTINIRQILPYKFIIDSVKIRSTMNNPSIIFNGEDSYGSTALFFKIFGFKYNSSTAYEAMFSIIPFYLFLFLIIFILKINLTDFKPFILCSISTFLFLIYYSVFSKDLIAFCFLLAPFYFSKTKFFIPLFLFFSFLYGIYFRQYWLIYILLISMFIFFDKLKISFRLQVMFSILAIFLICMGYFMLEGSYLSVIRENTHSVLTANTNINNLFSASNILYDFMNAINTLINLFIPLNGLGSVNEVLYYIMLYYLLFNINVALKKNYFNNKYIFNIFYSFILVQSLFEPDMGSAFRHQLVLNFYLVFMLLDMNKKMEVSNEVFNSNPTL